MSYTREQLIEILTPALVKSTASTPDEVRSVLETYTVEGLNKEFSRQRKAGVSHGTESPQQDSSSEQAIIEAIRAEARRQVTNDPEQIHLRQEHARLMEATHRNYAMTQIFNTAVQGHGYPVQNRAAETLIEGWLNPGETLSREFLVKIIQENPSLASQLQWRSVNPKQAEARQQELDKQTFAAAAKTLRTFGVNEANFNLIRQVLGAGFSVYTIQQALASNALELSGPSQSELDAWKASDIEEHNRQLLQADPTTLRVLARQESADKRVQEQQQQANSQFEAARQRDEVMGYPPLPADITKESLLSMVKTDTQKYRFILKKFGNANVTARLQNRS